MISEQCSGDGFLSSTGKKCWLHGSLAWEGGYGRQRVCLLLYTLLHSLFSVILLHLLYFYSEMRERTSMAGSGLINLWALDLAFWLDFLLTNEADTGTSEHFNGPCGPINLQVVFFQPGKFKYKIFFPNANDHKHCPFIVSIILEYQLHYFLN